MLSVGVIPGPKKPGDLDSFLWPLVRELIQLAIGVTTFDALAKVVFMLHAYLIVVFGDIPAVSMLMRVKGTNACVPCRMCEIKAIRAPNSGPTGTLYVPLNRSRFPPLNPAASPEPPPSYLPGNLPLRTHNRFMAQAREIQEAPTKAAAEKLSVQYGISGLPLLCCLSSLSFPISFPYDFMHLVWCNLIDNLLELWKGSWKDIAHTNQPYTLDENTWKAIGRDTEKSGSFIPAAFGARVPNFADGAYATSEMRSIWTLYLAPAILRGRLKEPYYTHFMDLVTLLKTCLEFEFDGECLNRLENGFAKWVTDYESLYYQHDPNRVSACPLTLHALLHIAPSIRAMGPVWAYWAFPVERHCGNIVRHIRNRWRPYVSINRYVTSRAHLAQITLLYNLDEEFSLDDEPPRREHFTCEPYSNFSLSPPIWTPSILSRGIWLKLTAALATQFDVSAAHLRQLLPEDSHVTQYGRVTQLGGGDKMQARDLVKLAYDGQDMSYVRYQLLVDKHARRQRRKPEFELREHYGQLLRVIVVDLPPSEKYPTKVQPGTHIYAAIHNVDAVAEEVCEGTDVVYLDGADAGRTEVVDLNAIQCVIGRIKLGDRWAVVDRHIPTCPIHVR